MSNLNDNTKSCSSCKVTKVASSEFFYKNSSSKDGLDCRCKECSKASALMSKYGRSVTIKPPAYRLTEVPPTPPGTMGIAITKGKVVLIDECDADLAKIKWSAVEDYSGYYAHAKINGETNKKNTGMHRIILARKIGRPLAKGEMADHINKDTLDNRRSNLRIASRAQNVANSKIRKDNSSGYKGVNWVGSRGKWRALITINGKPKHLGMFKTAEEASQAYKSAAIELYGEFFSNDEIK